MFDNLKLKEIEQDNFYYPLYLKHGFDFIEDAGFFFSESIMDLEESLKILCTPLNHIKEPSTKKHCLLVTTGSMCPIHDGHIEMMTKAKERLELAGYEVLGGYIAPDHDSHVQNKNNEQAIPVSERNSLVSKMIWKHGLEDWLSLDPWYGTFTKTDLNFTNIITRLKLYCKRYISLDTDIFYVCGGDRQNFSKAFTEQGNCVVVTRPGYKCNIEETDRIFIAENNNPISSTEIRCGIYTNKKHKKLKIRNDNSPLLPFYIKYFDEIESVSSDDQNQIFNELDTSVIISLDPLIRDKYYLQVSRSYDLFGHNKLGYHLKSGDLPVDRSTSYTLYDDDIYTGETMRFASKYLESVGINIESYFSFNLSEKNCEILDNRDFILFGKNNGLIVELLGDHYRVPYIYPFVDPLMRCSVVDSLQFSIDVWAFNAEIHKDSDMVLNDTSSIFSKLGFSEDMKLYDICRFYLNFLRNLNNEIL